MKTKVNDYVTAIICTGNIGKVVQCQVTTNPLYFDRMDIGGVEVEDYRDDYDCYFYHYDNGEMYTSVRILETAKTLRKLKINLAKINVPVISKTPIDKLYGNGIEREDIAFFNDLMMSPAVMYDLCKTNTIEEAQDIFVKETLQNY